MDDDNKSDTSNEEVVFDTVKLISSDGFEFIIDRKCAMISGTIKNMLSSPGNLFIIIIIDIFLKKKKIK